MGVDASDPLFDPTMVFGELRPSEELREQILSEEWFPSSAPSEARIVGRGNRIAWLDESGDQIVRVDATQVAATPGNVFDPAKLATFAAMIRAAEIPLSFVPRAHLVPVDLGDVIESQQARKEDLEFDGFTRPFTTDNEELDAYLLAPEAYIDENLYDDQDDDERAELVRDMETIKANAVSEGWGDIGTVVARIDSGNHRAFAAFMAGEPEIWVRAIGSNDLKASLMPPR